MDREREGRKLILMTHALMNCLSFLLLLYNGGEEVDENASCSSR